MSYTFPRYRGGDLTADRQIGGESTASYAQQTKDDGEPSHIYYNITIRHQDTLGLGKKIPATFTDYRISPIVKNPSNYYFSLVRFYCPTQTIPIMVVPIMPFGSGNTNPNLTTFSVTLSYLGADFTAPIIWETMDKTAIIPGNLSASNPLQNVSGSYYYLYSYMNLVNLINDAFAAALAALVAANAPLSGLIAAPLLNYNPATSLFSISAQKDYYNLDAGTPISIYINNNLQNLLLNFDYRYLGSSTQKAWNFNMVLDGVQDVDNPLIVLQQEVNSLDAWSSLSSLVFVSNTIPVAAEGIPPAVPFGGDTISGATPVSTTAILTDFLASGANTRVSLSYSSIVYRMLDMVSDRPLMTTDVSIMWQDIYGNMYPLLLDSNTAATIKILFRKKSLGI